VRERLGLFDWGERGIGEEIGWERESNFWLGGFIGGILKLCCKNK